MESALTKILKNEQKRNIAIYGNTKKKSSFPVFHGEDEENQNFSEWAGQKGIDAIILTEQLIAKQDVFSQLMGYCKENDADIYDELGRNVSKVCLKALNEPYIDKKSLLSEIKEHECISFDLFDTLLTRKVLLPGDVFELTDRRIKQKGIVIKNFCEKRKKAQEELGLTNPDIYQIYQKFKKKYNITEQIALECLAAEMDIENEVLVVRYEMLEIYRQCIDMGKKVTIVTDMYIPAEILESILENKDIKDYDKLYISCDKKQLKLQGLLETYAKEAEGTTYLHIGDHLIHDGVCAGLAGIDYNLISSGYKMAQKTLFKESIEKAKSLEEHVMLGLVIAKMMNSPFTEIGTDGIIPIITDYDYGYGFCGALVSQYALWIYDQVKREHYNDILFAARDGFLMKKMYQIICSKRNEDELPKGIYFYTSRKAAVMTGINNEASINMIIDISPGMGPQKMMRERFGLSSGKILKYDKEKYGESVHPYVWEHAEAIFDRAREAKRNYFKYMGNIGLAIGKKYAFMDFVSSGTTQKSLDRIVPFKIEGLYAGWNGSENPADVGVMSLFCDRESFFMRRFKIIETFMTSEEPSVNYFDEIGNPVFTYQDRSEEELNYVRQMQNACVDFLTQLLELLEPEPGNIRNRFTDSIFAVSSTANIKDETSVLNHLRLMDDWRKKRTRIEQMIQ